ncbi:MAG TPA: arginase family protein [Candidatus Dormibacteraeota bacterium]|jgi:arginase family enzyme|nr:arginase family protein [Candidatus Dormibacteraeota bacterium]
MTPREHPLPSQGVNAGAARPAPPACVGFLDRLSERTVYSSRGAEALAWALSKRLGTQPVLVGTPGMVAESDWEEDLEDSREHLADATRRVEEILAQGLQPVLFGGDCSIALGTLPALAQYRPDAWLLWIDAHGDFNSPDTTPSNYLGGMALAGACGIWDTGLGLGPDLSRVVLCSTRDLDPDELKLIQANDVQLVDAAGAADALRGRDVFVHLDLDVLDPSVLPGTLQPVPGGLDEDQVQQLLREVAGAANLIGCEFTNMTAPELAGRIAGMVAPLFG